MKYLFWTFAFIITAVCLYFIFSNISAISGITLLDNGLAEALGTFSRRMQVNTGLLLFIFFILGSCSTMLFVQPFLSTVQKKERLKENLKKQLFQATKVTPELKFLKLKFKH